MKSMKTLIAVMGLCCLLLAAPPVTAQNPVVDATAPAQNAINVSKNPAITVSFSQPMDPGTFQFNSSFIVQGSKTGLHSGVIDFDGGLQSATFDNIGPPFAWGEEVTVTLTTDLASATGYPLDKNYVFNFTIEAMRGPSQFLGTATIPVGFIPYGIYAAEMNGTDTDIDLVVSGWTDNVVILENQGAGVFAAADTSTVGTLPHAIVGYDNNLDGLVDLATANWTDNTITVLVNQGNLDFFVLQHKAVGTTPTHVAAADLNGDGYKDLAVTNMNANNVSVLFNIYGDGFTNPTNYAVGTAPRHVAAADIDHDYDIDLVVANWGSDNLTVLSNDGNGIFAATDWISVGPAPMSVIIANLDNFGLPDFAAPSYTGDYVLIMLRDAVGNISAGSYPSQETPREIVAVDIDGDRDLDLAADNYDPSRVSVLLNDGGGYFGPYTEYSCGDNPYNIVGADLDGDGDMDLATSNYTSEDVTILEPTPLIFVLLMDPANLVNMLITDPLGRRLGYGENAMFYDEIPTGDYYQPIDVLIARDSAIIREPVQGEYVVDFFPQIRDKNITTYSAIVKTDGTLETVIVEGETVAKQALFTYYYSVEEGYHYKNGDASRDEDISVGDAVFIINYVFKGGPEPYPIYAGDANCDKGISVADAVHIINFIFKGGNKPCCCELCGDVCP